MDNVETFTLFVIQNLVQFPELVRVEKAETEQGSLLSVTVDPSDMGRVIGKKGSTAQSVRHLLQAIGAKHDAHYSMRVVDSNPNKESSNA